MNKVTVKIECKACNGTGLFRGFAEPEGTAVVCLNCKGTGGVDLTYIPFTRRKEREGVRTVQLSRGSFVATGVGSGGRSISYQDFLDGKMPS